MRFRWTLARVSRSSREAAAGTDTGPARSSASPGALRPSAAN